MIERLKGWPRRNAHGGPSGRRRRLVLTAFLLVCTAASPALAAPPTEHTLKAAYLYNFTRYISWPNDAWSQSNQDFAIGVIGPNPFGTTLDKIAEKRLAQGRRIEIRHYDTLADYRPCHILFVSAQNADEVHAATLRQTRNQPVLVIGERTGFAADGASANLVLMQDGSIKIEMNIDALNRARLQANAQLLTLATLVRDRGTE